MTNKISSASQTVRAFNVGTLGDCSAWDDNLDAAILEWLPAEEAPSFMSGTGSDEVCESGIGFAQEREGCCLRLHSFLPSLRLQRSVLQKSNLPALSFPVFSIPRQKARSIRIWFSRESVRLRTIRASRFLEERI